MSEQDHTEPVKDGLYAKLARIQGKTGAVEKTGEVSYGGTNYKHFQEHTLMAEIKPLLATEGLALMCGIESYERQGNSTILVFRLTLVDGSTGETHTELFPNEGVDAGDKGFNKAYTAAMKYALQKLFLIPTEKVDDNDSNDVPTSTRGKAKGNGQPTTDANVGEHLAASTGQSIPKPQPLGEKGRESLRGLANAYWAHGGDEHRLELKLAELGADTFEQALVMFDREQGKALADFLRQEVAA